MGGLLDGVTEKENELENWKISTHVLKVNQFRQHINWCSEFDEVDERRFYLFPISEGSTEAIKNMPREVTISADRSSNGTPTFQAF
ncbi:hypothetical protein J6590_043493 [Homalodisca vitripennis]|nr:hypothetical protein J6590_043493 [Homalodisca vitripennis]